MWAYVWFFRPIKCHASFCETGIHVSMLFTCIHRKSPDVKKQSFRICTRLGIDFSVSTFCLSTWLTQQQRETIMRRILIILQSVFLFYCCCCLYCESIFGIINKINMNIDFIQTGFGSFRFGIGRDLLHQIHGTISKTTVILSRLFCLVRFSKITNFHIHILGILFRRKFVTLTEPHILCFILI